MFQMFQMFQNLHMSVMPHARLNRERFLHELPVAPPAVVRRRRSQGARVPFLLLPCGLFQDVAAASTRANALARQHQRC